MLCSKKLNLVGVRETDRLLEEQDLIAKNERARGTPRMNQRSHYQLQHRFLYSQGDGRWLLKS